MRVHVYAIKKTSLPTTSLGDQDPVALESELRSVISSESLGPKPGRPVYQRAAHPAPTTLTAALEAAHMQKFSQRVSRPLELTQQGGFRARRRVEAAPEGGREGRHPK